MTMNDSQATLDVPRQRLVRLLGTAVILAAVLLVTVVLPAEYGVDPLGTGAATGLVRLARHEPASAVTVSVASSRPAPYLSERVAIPLAAAGDESGADGIEWKVQMRAGDTFVYSWRAQAGADGSAAPGAETVYFDFHGETATPDARPMTYARGLAAAGHGALVAPFDGIHGWFLQNQLEEPVTVHLQISGFFARID